VRRWFLGGGREQGLGHRKRRKVVGFIGARRSGIWQAGSRRRIGLGLVLESGLATGGEFWADQRVLQFSEQREHRRGNGKTKRERPSEFGYGLKQVWVRVEHGNELTELVEHEQFIRERGKEKGGIRPSRW
jgi:hypothetical protein